ncbi:hypothetical protein TVAG_362250 [Trichomonas vaginalis G3]|uniref:Uncharacterized protein n=1 Tax=Trichomonas vaginalis (strain ATCC PRA-98 / G3) TaxID=412133 RepID=A2GAR6_TRIV3|nr:hypothetical protein TVAGG3_0773280 [Trichomonas vaginalis G3]EAX85752.1 hypothetical protein TVAG_362250 [Trichomonas vaginalis G3]KAI5513973.1 hypothetical protein TVAGG3_0773280 [Trichomonas vaginalis G3]|eukprot:XP_001298682.1 hypothetical protein [Trichomonas vaginalis G3]
MASNFTHQIFDRLPYERQQELLERGKQQARQRQLLEEQIRENQQRKALEQVRTKSNWEPFNMPNQRPNQRQFANSNGILSPNIYANTFKANEIRPIISYFSPLQTRNHNFTLSHNPRTISTKFSSLRNQLRHSMPASKINSPRDFY